ncbi:MAG: sulfite exporter TauE/SafE family protein [Acidobacteriota bacterium]
MLSIKGWLFVALGAFAVFYLAVWVSDLLRRRRAEAITTGVNHSAIGFITNFFDTLGIGSFATTTSMYKFWKLVDDRVIPGTLNVGHTPPTITQAFIYIAIIGVDMKTLILLIASSVAGAWLGAGVVAKWSRRKVQIGMGIALLAAATLMFLSLRRLVPAGGAELGLEGKLLWIGMAGNFVLGALMTLGIGLYAPCLIMISLLGMDSRAAYPVMMGSCAFLMPVGSARFVREGSYDLKASIGLAIGGTPAVLIAAYIVGSLDLDKVRWLVIAVVLYTATMMLRSAFVERRQAVEEPSAAD